MAATATTVGDLHELSVRLRAAWRASTSSDPERWTTQNPAWGQCAVTALVVQDMVGGTLRRAEVGDISHYWNRLEDGEEFDLTRDQFPPDVAIGRGEERSREYVLSFAETRERYEELRRHLGGTRRRK